MINQKQIDELVKFGEKIEVKVTPKFIHGVLGFGIRKLWFTDYLRAVLQLQYIQRTEAESMNGLVA